MIRMFLVLGILAGVLIAGCGGGEEEPQTQAVEEEAPAVVSQVVELSLGGMHCEGCAGTIQAALGELDAVEACSVSYADSLARVTVSAAEVDPAALIAAVEGAGYRATVIPAPDETWVPEEE